MQVDMCPCSPDGDHPSSSLVNNFSGMIILRVEANKPDPKNRQKRPFPAESFLVDVETAMGAVHDHRVGRLVVEVHAARQL